MTDNNSTTETNKYLFINLVTMLGLMAMQQLGKVINPLTGKTAISLDAAQATIDTLDMLGTKTEGKLDNDEARLLKDTLAALKMNYVETKGDEEVRGQKSEVRGQSTGAAETRKTEPQSSETSDQKPEPQRSEIRNQQDVKAQGTTETKDPKFHKNYH